MEPRISIITLGVSDMQRSWKFYHNGLGLPTGNKPTDAIIYFNLHGTVLGLYPIQKLIEDVSPDFPTENSRFSGVTIAHNTRQKCEVDQILRDAEKAGGKIEKPAQPTFWGGYSGYFSDPDGHLWEIAYADSWDFNHDGSLVL